MPIYEYRCAECGESFEAFPSRSDEPAPPCPQCGAAEVRRQLSVFSVTHPGDAPPGPCGSADCACRRS